MLGIGVTSYNRPDHLNLCLEQIRKHTPEFAIYIAMDEPRQGIAYRKNECLENLKECDYVVLFDDDCFPIKDGWQDFLIDAHKRTNEHHFLYLKETPSIKLLYTKDGIGRYNNCGGCMMFLTKEAIERVGGMNKGYNIYGFEHAGYSYRVNQAKLTTHAYLSPDGIGEYIYSLDYDFHIDFGIKHVSSLRSDFRDMRKLMADNHKVYLKDIQTIYQPL